MSISKNMRKGVQMRMQNGTYQISRMPYGYEFGKNGEYVINEKEAEVVRYIFDQFLTGAGVDEIAKSLQAREVRRRDGSLRWYGYSIGYILKNEKYVGDELLGKLDALAKQITQLRYLAIDPQNHAYKTEQILKTLNGTASQKDAADLLQKIVSRILLDKNGSVQVKLINGQIV